eukprot:TRINITY_DN7550_c0_g1_i1.p1 TRINITY_DN7550_c0_g1~~TRINITY_DN7550_c0_g1_i1.p1  ORF type:complete len:298 (-),score=47.17 TRINITY_DN7550_c0_g1_i1:191-1084(-)
MPRDGCSANRSGLSESLCSPRHGRLKDPPQHNKAKSSLSALRNAFAAAVIASGNRWAHKHTRHSTPASSDAEEHDPRMLYVAMPDAPSPAPRCGELARITKPHSSQQQAVHERSLRPDIKIRGAGQPSAAPAAAAQDGYVALEDYCNSVAAVVPPAARARDAGKSHMMKHGASYVAMTHADCRQKHCSVDSWPAASARQQAQVRQQTEATLARTRTLGVDRDHLRARLQDMVSLPLLPSQQTRAHCRLATEGGAFLQEKLIDQPSHAVFGEQCGAAGAPSACGIGYQPPPVRLLQQR